MPVTLSHVPFIDMPITDQYEYGVMMYGNTFSKFELLFIPKMFGINDKKFI